MIEFLIAFICIGTAVIVVMIKYYNEYKRFKNAKWMYKTRNKSDGKVYIGDLSPAEKTRVCNQITFGYYMNKTEKATPQRTNNI